MYKKKPNKFTNSNSDLLETNKTLVIDEGEQNEQNNLSGNDGFLSCINSNLKNLEYHNAKRFAMGNSSRAKEPKHSKSDFDAVRALLELQNGTGKSNNFTGIYDSFLINQYEYNRTNQLNSENKK